MRTIIGQLTKELLDSIGDGSVAITPHLMRISLITRRAEFQGLCQWVNE